MRLRHALVAGLLLSATAAASTADDLSEYVGYTIVASETITGWRDEDGKRGDELEGCEFDRTIIVEDGRALTCSTYSYHYAYRPRAVILANGTSIKMIVEDETYDMRR